MKMSSLVMVSLCAAPIFASAIEPGPSSEEQQVTERWLTMQSRNEQASRIVQTETPKERDLAMQRWLDSYLYKIPDKFDLGSMKE